MPIETTVYRCGVCKESYDEESTAEKCEKKHGIPVHIVERTYSAYEPEGLEGIYPVSLEVGFNDGITAIYKFVRVNRWRA